MNESHHTYPLACLTDQQMHEQLQHYIAVHALPTGMNTIYYLLTPPGLTVCLDAVALKATARTSKPPKKKKKHTKSKRTATRTASAAITPMSTRVAFPTGDPSTILYAVIPWTAGGLDDGQLRSADQTKAFYCQDGGFNAEKNEAREETLVVQEPNQPEKCPTVIGDGFCDMGLSDLIINQIAQEQENMVTNPLLNAWQDPAGNEATDECRNFFAPVEGSYAAKPETEAGTLFNQSFDAGTRRYYINDAVQPRRPAPHLPGHPLHGRDRPGTEIHSAQPGQRGRHRQLRRDGVDHHSELGVRLRSQRGARCQLRHLQLELRRRIDRNIGLRPRGARLLGTVARPCAAASSTHTPTAANTT